MKPKHLDAFMDTAYRFAELSEAVRARVGAIIVKDRRIISIGYNGFPRGVKDLAKRYEDRPTKHLFVAHAERNALDNSPMSVEGCTMYVPLMPCNECAKSIIQRGIKKVICYQPDREDTFNWEITELMFKEAGVMLYKVKKEND